MPEQDEGERFDDRFANDRSRDFSDSNSVQREEERVRYSADKRRQCRKLSYALSKCLTAFMQSHRGSAAPSQE